MEPGTGTRYIAYARCAAPDRVYQEPWTAEALIEEIRRKHRAGEPLNARDVTPNWIRRPAGRLFGSWDAALAAAGLDPMEIRGNRPRT